MIHVGAGLGSKESLCGDDLTYHHNLWLDPKDHQNILSIELEQQNAILALDDIVDSSDSEDDDGNNQSVVVARKEETRHIKPYENKSITTTNKRSADNENTIIILD